jgi:UDPglucose--hexose-1-phosphate uridylyltransferase
VSELRLDPLSGEWITVAAKRLGRPVTTSARDCPFCPAPAGAGQKAEEASEAPRADYGVAVFENRFPAFSPRPEAEEPALGGDGLYRAEPARGRAEIVLYSPRHDVHLATMPTAQVRLLVDVWQDRTEALYADPAVQYVFVFENRGHEIGQTIDHPHGQIYGYPFLPPRVARERELVLAHRREEGDCLQCAILRAEEADGRRLVEADDDWLAFVPFAPRFPFELHLVPRRHAGWLGALGPTEKDGLARLLQRTLARYDGLHATPMPYMMCIFQAPRADLGGDLWHLRVAFYPLHRAQGRMKYLAGSESGAGAFLQDARPEDMAAALRAVGAGARR